MSLLFRLFLLLLLDKTTWCYEEVPPIEKLHYPWGSRKPVSRFIKGSTYEVPDEWATPDYRYPEPPFTAYSHKFYREEERPYRFSPHYKSYYRFIYNYHWFGRKMRERPWTVGCYCVTVFKRLTPLAGCAVITTRHILTTATSTELILKDYKHEKTLENILGAWYDIDEDLFNSSMYMTPARIHYHPKYIRPTEVNITHPLSVVYDLAVWAATYRFYGSMWTMGHAVLCDRASSGWFEYSSPTPRGRELAYVVGFQFMKAWWRVPMPWFKYIIRTRKHWPICPKTDWGWFICLNTYWAKYGVESGAAWHRELEGIGWRYTGLLGLNALTMKLRSRNIISYFTVLDTFPVLDFLYDVYMGWPPYEYLDYRFYNSQGRAPVQKPWFYIPWEYKFGEELFEDYVLPYYK